ncbi:MAG: phosphatidate cytidylyltransferase [Oscillospiraceae bacterium]|nr:phosphatidate cytidylyltransferase [Oscillospiraceae bacterium]
MKTRIISAVVAVPVVLCVLILLPARATVVMTGLIVGTCIYEVGHAFGKFAREHDKKIKSVLLPSLALCVLITAALGWPICRLREVAFGEYLVLLPFISAFVTDAGAYFVGVTIGKHHIFPKISPKKSLEGFIGGIVIGTAAVVLYWFILSRVIPAGTNFELHYGTAIICGLCGAVATEAGDLLFSWIKRRLGIKDYGSIIPGHGGMLDRFDSMVLCAPVMLAFARLAPALLVWVY